MYRLSVIRTYGCEHIYIYMCVCVCVWPNNDTGLECTNYFFSSLQLPPLVADNTIHVSIQKIKMWKLYIIFSVFECITLYAVAIIYCCLLPSYPMFHMTCCYKMIFIYNMCITIWNDELHQFQFHLFHYNVINHRFIIYIYLVHAPINWKTDFPETYWTCFGQPS